MCGIAGIIAPQVNRYRDTIQRMTSTLAHRGPDDSGMHFFERCDRRLSTFRCPKGS